MLLRNVKCGYTTHIGCKISAFLRNSNRPLWFFLNFCNSHLTIPTGISRRTVGCHERYEAPSFTSRERLFCGAERGKSHPEGSPGTLTVQARAESSSLELCRAQPVLASKMQRLGKTYG